MIYFHDKPALLQEWPIRGWDGMAPRRGRLHVVKMKVDFSFDGESREEVNALVNAFQGLFQEGKVVGPDNEPMKLGSFGKMEAGPPLMFGKVEKCPPQEQAKEATAETTPGSTRPLSINATPEYMEEGNGSPSRDVPSPSMRAQPSRRSTMADPATGNDDPFEEVKAEKKAEDKPGFFRHWGFKFFGALFMRDKGTNGKANMAVSNHKTVGMLLLFTSLWMWCFGGTWLNEEQTMHLLSLGHQLPSKWGEPPDMLIYTFWAALGLKGVLDVAGNFKK